MSSTGAFQLRSAARTAFGNFLVALSQFGTWWHGISLEDTSKWSLSKVCGFVLKDLQLLFIYCGLTNVRQTRVEKIFNLFLQEIGLGSDSSSAAEIAKARFGSDRHCLWIRLGKFLPPKWKPLEIMSKKTTHLQPPQIATRSERCISCVQQFNIICTYWWIVGSSGCFTWIVASASFSHFGRHPTRQQPTQKQPNNIM